VELRTIIPSVIDILKSEFPALRSMDLEPDTRLLSTGLLDSFALVTLLAALESAFTINVDVDSIQIEEFETPSTIAGICQGALRGGKQGA
jgi:D-alanine--poly(phosphoribitol) ligase subunit 2